MDEYNPLFSETDPHDVESILRQQNLVYGANTWYNIIKDYTPESELLKLSDNEIKTFSKGEIPDKIELFKTKIMDLITKYQFVKTTHASSHSFKPMLSYEDFCEEMTNARIIMSFRRYKCEYLFFRKWTTINCECRIYVYHNEIKYMECYRDINKIFNPKMFKDMYSFVTDTIIPLTKTTWSDFTIDLYLDEDTNTWKVIEINSPMWLYAGAYLIDYQWNKKRIHETNKPICHYRDNNNDIMVYDF